MRHSIRRRLLVGLTAATVTLWLLVIAATYRGANHEVGSLFDTQLEQSARVATRTLFGLPTPEVDAPEPGDQYRKNLVIQVWDDEGELIVHSRNAPRQPLTDQTTGFADSTVNGERWRTYSFYDEANGLTIRAGEPYSPRDYLTRHVVTQTMYPILIGLPVVTLLIWIIVGRGFGPLKRLAEDVHRRDPDNLDPIVAPYAPAEVNSLVTELNELLTRLKHKIDNERHFVADAAHELRTPLAGLKVQAEVALGARNDSERTRALNNILVGVDRASHLVNQLLTLSRLDESGSFLRETVDLDQTVRTVILDALAGADQQNIELSFEPNASHATKVHGNPDALYVLVRNLVDNAVKYSPPGTLVTVATRDDVSGITLTVLDQGPGIPPADRETVFDRFHRRGMSDAYGSGLGLSIVRRVLDLHGGSIVLGQAPGGGLEVNVSFPAHPRDDDRRDPRTTRERSQPRNPNQGGELSRA
jgi:two-component system, OmpR family, sensor histidine kinase QseC